MVPPFLAKIMAVVIFGMGLLCVPIFAVMVATDNMFMAVMMVPCCGLNLRAAYRLWTERSLI